MQTQAYFDDIQLQILHELRKATSSIHIAVAWFTDPDIFEQLCQKAGSGIRVGLIVVNDSINRKGGLRYERLRDLGGIFMMIGDNKKNSTTMHNKFCVIDGVTVITGSYNWSRKAKQNSENIAVISGHPELAQQFIEEFESILERHSDLGVAPAPKAEKTTSIEWFNKAVDLERKKVLPGLLNHALRWTQDQPEDADAWYFLGNTYSGIDQTAKAIEAYQQALHINPEDAAVWNNLGNAYKNSNQTSKAIEAYQQAIRINPEDDSAWYNLGIPYKDSNQIPKAIEAYQQAIRINPEYADAWNNLGLVYEGSNHITKEIEAYQQAIRINPEHTNAWSNLGNAYIKSNQIAKAIEAYQQAIRINPKDADAWYNRGIVYIKSNQIAKAIEAFQQAISNNPEHAKAWYALGLSYKKSNQTSQIMEVYKRLKILAPAKADEFFSL
jgi:tetratricopeptide (TPR) repeat protein